MFLIYTCSYFISSGSKLPTFLSSSRVLKGLSTAPARYIDSNVNEGVDPGAVVSFILYTAIPDVLPIPTNTRRVSSSSSPMVNVSASGPWQKKKRHDLRNLKLCSIRVKELFQPTVLRKKKGRRVFALSKSIFLRNRSLSNAR